MGWEQTIVIIVTVIAAIGGFFYWLRKDINKLRSETKSDIKELRAEMKKDMDKLEAKMDAGFKDMDARLRAVESEQSRVAGLLEGLGLSGALPIREASQELS